MKKNNKDNELTTQNIASSQTRKQNWFIKFWNYFSTYEKLWLLFLWVGGITISILFPEGPVSIIILSIITLMGGCSCELLLSKQSKWAFIVSFFFYDLTQTIIYFANGYYVSAIFEIIFWMPMLFISFFSWDKKQDKIDDQKTQVKSLNLKKELSIFLIVLAVSFAAGAVFTFVGGWFEGISDYWYIDAMANTFSVCNGLFLWLRYKEQWIAWLGVTLCETIMWIISHNWAMLILQIGYLTNTIYGYIQWTRYVKKNRSENLSNESDVLKLSNKEE